MDKKMLLIGLSVILTVFLSSPLETLGQGDTYQLEGPRPGETDPMRTNQLVLFRDDELLMVVKDHAANQLVLRAFAPDNADLTKWEIKESNDRSQKGSMDESQIAIASGRISEPAVQDDVVLAFYDEGASAYQVELYRSTERIAQRTISGTADTHSSVGVAVGDLDRLVDGNGLYHDEIVFVRNHSVGNGSYELLVDVLDQHLQTLGSAEVPFGNPALHVAVVIGDFDGDGNFEFATGQTGGNNPYQVELIKKIAPKFTAWG